MLSFHEGSLDLKTVKELVQECAPEVKARALAIIEDKGRSADIVLYDGDLKLEGSFSLAKREIGLLIVKNHILADGVFEDSPDSCVVVLGSFRSQSNVITHGMMEVKRQLTATSVLFLGTRKGTQTRIGGELMASALVYSTPRHSVSVHGAVVYGIPVTGTALREQAGYSFVDQDDPRLIGRLAASLQGAPFDIDAITRIVREGGNPSAATDDDDADTKKKTTTKKKEKKEKPKKMRMSPVVPKTFLELETPRECPSCKKSATRFRELVREGMLVCPNCARSFPKEAPKPVVPKKKKTKPVGAPSTAFNAALAKRLDASPDDAAAWAVYADWLSEQGDPRGELASIQIQLATDPKNKQLRAAEKKILRDHGETILGRTIVRGARDEKGQLSGFRETNDPPGEGFDEPVRLGWRAGFLSHLSIGAPGWNWKPKDEDGDVDVDVDPEEKDDFADVAATLKAVLSTPSARFLSSLQLRMPNEVDEGEAFYSEIIKVLAKHEAGPRLRSLYIGDIISEECEVSNVDGSDISKLYPNLKNLRSLVIRAGQFKLGKEVVLPELRSLHIITGGLDRKNVAAICASKWPKLEKLDLWLGTSSYGGSVKVKDLAPIFEGKAFPKVKHLGIKNSEIADEIAAVVGSAPIVKRLETLDLSKGTMSDAGAKSLADAKKSLSHLAHLDLSDNFITASAVKLVSKIAKTVTAKPQGPTDTDYRYVTLSE